MKQLGKVAEGAAPKVAHYLAQDFARFAAILTNYEARPRKRTVVLPGKQRPDSDCVLELNGVWPNRLNRRSGSPVHTMARGESSDDKGVHFKIHPHKIHF